MLAAAPGVAAPEGRIKLAQATANPEPLAGSRPQAGSQSRAQTRPARRARPQIRVYSRYPYRRYHSIYPLPYPIEYPGPHAVRHCTSHYEVELRPSGNVVVPRMRCWWAPG
jgi:hypothetical protein